MKHAVYARPTCDLLLSNSWSRYAGTVFKLTNIYILKGFKLKEKLYIVSKMIRSVLHPFGPQVQKSRRHCQKYLIFMIWKNPRLLSSQIECCVALRQNSLNPHKIRNVPDKPGRIKYVSSHAFSAICFD